MKYLICLVAIFIFINPIKGYADAIKPVKSRKIEIEVHFSQVEKGDILTIFLLDKFYRGESNAIEVSASVDKDSTFYFHIPVKRLCGYFKIERRLRPGEQMKSETGSDFILLSPRFFWMAGDKVRINIIKKKKQVNWYVNPPERFNFYFTGPNAFKYQVGYAIDSALTHTQNKNPGVFHGKDFSYSNPYKESILTANKILNKDSSLLPQFFIQVKKADIISHGFTATAARVRVIYKSLLKDDDSSKLKDFKESFWKSPIAKPFHPDIPVGALANSPQYCVFQLLQQQLIYFMKHGEDNPDSLYYQIKKRFTGELRDVFLTDFFNRMHPNQLNKLYRDALKTIKTSSCLHTLDMLKRRNSGFDAYDFSLPDISGKIIHLHDLYGKVVLIDFWFTGCDGCEWYYKTVLSKVEPHFGNNPKVAFVTVSIDSRRDLWLHGLKSGDYTSPQAINLFTEGLCNKDPMFQYYRVQATPTVVLIDSKGKIRLFNGSELYNISTLVDLINETIPNH
jgi:cytochrome oxidase Cu insertion factor (SCO1/SenC/PrrC family)